MTATVSQLSVYLDRRRAAVDEALGRFLPPDVPGVLDAAMRYSLLGGGKRLRPILTLAAAEAVTQSDTLVTVALPAACALEMIHTYSLIHDDLPAMDDDSLRRGRPTSHIQFGEGMAVLAGDGLLTEAFALLAREPQAASAEIGVRKMRTLALIADAAGACGMVGGQAIDLHAARPHVAATAAALDRDSLRDMHARKTGALIRAAAGAGAIMAGATPEAEAAIAAYATDLGLAFQIVDDVLDIEGTAADLGKTAGKDAASGKPTYPSLYGLDASKRLARDAVDRARAAIAAAGVGGRLPEIAEWVVVRSH